MAQTFRIETQTFSGVNYADDPSSMLLRSHDPVQWGFQQKAPMEFKHLRNMDFRPSGIIKRNGSTLLASITMVANDVLVDGIEFVTNGGTRTLLIVSKKTIYYSTDAGVTWTQINDSGASPYAHAADVTKCSFAVGDGRVFIGLDGANKIQMYQTGTGLNAQYANGNTYPAIYSGSNTITGTIGTGYYIVAWFQNRLVFCNGNSTVEYTPAGAPWDRANGGFDLARAAVVAIRTFSIHGQDENREVIYYSTVARPDAAQIKSGFDVTDQPYNVTGSHTALNHRCMVGTLSWIMYPTIDQTVEAISPAGIMDVGRRLKANDGSTGILDTISLANSQSLAFGFWYEKNRQAQWYIVDSGNSTVSHAIINDLFMGEPVPGDVDTTEKRLRHLVWSIQAPASNTWFCGVFQARGSVLGITSNGKVYTLDSGASDLGSLPILDDLKTPDFTPMVARKMSWRSFRPRFDVNGAWNVSANYYLDGEGVATGSTATILQENANTSTYDVDVYDTAIYGAGGHVNGFAEVDLHSESLGIQLYNQQVGQPWKMTSFIQEYSVGETT